jgi:hypothetical protein
MARCLVILSCILCTAVTYADDVIDADRPGIADGSHTLKAGKFQVEAGVDTEHVSLPALLRYGLNDSFELRAENDNGSAPFSLGFKDHFLDNGTDSLGVIGRWFLSHHRHGDARLAGDFNLGEHWAINPNVGVETPGGATAALTIQYNITQKANVFVDSGAERSNVIVDAGAAWIAGNNTQFDASVFRRVHGPAKTWWSAGISRRF